MSHRNVSAFVLLLYLLTSISFCLLNEAKAQTASSPKISLFAKAGSGDYYTLYPDGVEKEEAFIGGFKSAQLDPKKENIYFYDTTLKVIARINLQDKKVYKVIGKPKSNGAKSYSTPVKFNDASLGKLIDFTFDEYGNILILDLDLSTGSQRPRILKALLTDETITEVVNINNRFSASVKTQDTYDFTFNLAGITSNKNNEVYLYGKYTYKRYGYGLYDWSEYWKGAYSNGSGITILKYTPALDKIEIFGGSDDIKNLGHSPKLSFGYGPNAPQNLSIKSLTFDHNGTGYLSTQDYIYHPSNGWTWRSDIFKLLTTSDGNVSKESFIGDGSGTTDDIGDGGSAISAYAVLTGANPLCNDKNGDIYIADNGTNRIRKILKGNGLITTIAGSGSETISFGETKAPKVISLSSPTSLSTDKSNNLYIVEPGRILLVSNLVIHEDNPAEVKKFATLKITKIAGYAVKDPKGEVSTPDLNLSYTLAGDEIVEVKGENIPDGTNVKLLTITPDGTALPNPPSSKLAGDSATIPIKIEAGTTKVIKAETDPFIPAPGVYLPGDNKGN